MELNIGLPKGSLQDSTLHLLKKAGWNFTFSARAYRPYCDDQDLKALLIRAQEMSTYVEQGVLDAGFTGKDWIMENDSDVVEVCELVYAKASMRPVRWVIAVPEDSEIQSVKDLNGKRISTEVVNLTRRYLEQQEVESEIEFSWGATEIKPGLLSDAIVEVTETGSSLRANKLRIVDEVLKSTVRFIANKEAYKDPEKRVKIDTIAKLLQSAIFANSRVGLKMNVRDAALDAVLDMLPAMRSPTVSQLYQGKGVAVEIIVEESTVRNLIPKLLTAGATDIIEYPLNKVIPR